MTARMVIIVVFVDIKASVSRNISRKRTQAIALFVNASVCRIPREGMVWFSTSSVDTGVHDVSSVMASVAMMSMWSVVCTRS
jgi:hypothetical protein